MFAEGDRDRSSKIDHLSLWSPGLRWLTSGLVLTTVAVAFEALAVATILPATANELGGINLYGWAFSAFLLTNLVGITVAGSEADRVGPTRPFVIGVGLFIVGLLIGGIALSMPILIAARALQGFGGGIINAVAYAAIARAYPDTLKPKMIAVMATAWVVPGLIGPAIAGVVADYLGWRWIFLGLVPFPFLAALMTLPGLRTLSGGNDQPRAWSTILAAIMLAIGAGILLAGLAAQALLTVVLLIGLGAVIGGVALPRLLPPGTLRASYGMPAAIITSGILNMAFFGTDAYIPLGLNEVRGQTATMAGLTLTAATLTWTTGSWLQARLAASTSRRVLTSAGLALTAIGCTVVAAVMLPTVPVVVAPIAWGIAGLGMGIAFSTLSLVVLEEAPAGSEGIATAGVQLMNVLGSALGAGIGGALVARAHTNGVSVGTGIIRQDLLMVATLTIALLAAQRLPNRKSPPTTATNTIHVHAGTGG